MRKIAIAIFVFFANNVFAIDSVQIFSDIPAQQKNLIARTEALGSLQGMIQALSTAKNVQAQIETLNNLRNFQDHPGEAISEVNSAVSGLLNNFNAINGDASSVNSLSQLIGTLSTTITDEGMSLKLATAANMQLSAIQNVLQQMQAQQQAMLAYKQAEITQEQYKKTQTQANNDAMIRDMQKY